MTITPQVKSQVCIVNIYGRGRGQYVLAEKRHCPVIRDDDLYIAKGGTAWKFIDRSNCPCAFYELASSANLTLETRLGGSRPRGRPRGINLEKSAGMECEPSGEDGDYKCPRH